MTTLLQANANTQYFHLLANGRHRKTRIFRLEDGERIIQSDSDLREHITSFYKTHFGLLDDLIVQVDIGLDEMLVARWLARFMVSLARLGSARLNFFTS
jgi:hypothetical protein